MIINTVNSADKESRMSSDFPASEDCVFSAMLDRHSRETPDKPFVLFGSDTIWSYKDAQQVALSSAAALQALGIRQDDRVLVFLPNGEDILRLHLGLLYAGAVFVPINVALRGATLEHIITNSGARVIVCHSGLLERLSEISTGILETIVVAGALDAKIEIDLRLIPLSDLNARPEAFTPPPRQIEPWDVHGIFYTSGTTGVAKGVLCTHLHTTVMGRSALRFMTKDDRFLVNLPWFHLGGAFAFHAIAAIGASLAVLKEYRTQKFWDDVRATNSTACLMLGAISNFLVKQPRTDRDKDHPLRQVIHQPLYPSSMEFAERFGVEIHTAFDMTELPAPIVAGPITGEMPKNGYCGIANTIGPKIHIRLADSHDREVPAGQPGELLVRCDLPWVISHGYHDMPEATARVWRNGWFHTGDIFIRDEAGCYYFVDRAKDYIRRRGENISSTEVESEILKVEAVADVAAIGVPSAEGEDEVMAVIETKPGRAIDPAELTRHLMSRMPHYMVPRYLRLMDKLPYTDSNKIKKNELRAEGLAAPNIWDREAAGIKVRRQKLG